MIQITGLTHTTTVGPSGSSNYSYVIRALSCSPFTSFLQYVDLMLRRILSTSMQDTTDSLKCTALVCPSPSANGGQLMEEFLLVLLGPCTHLQIHSLTHAFIRSTNRYLHIKYLSCTVQCLGPSSRKITLLHSWSLHFSRERQIIENLRCKHSDGDMYNKEEKVW